MGKSFEERIRRHIENFANPDMRTYTRSKSWLLRHYGVSALDQLVEACGHPRPMVRYRAVWTLGHLKEPRAFKTILRLTDDPDEEVRYDAVMALGVLGDTRAIPHLHRMLLLLDHTRPASSALIQLGLAALPVAKKCMKNRCPEIRHAALNIIGNLAGNHGSPECLELLNKHLNDPDPEIRADTEFWLGEIAEK